MLAADGYYRDLRKASAHLPTKSSKPLIFGMVSSVMITSGSERRNSASAANPPVAVRTS